MLYNAHATVILKVWFLWHFNWYLKGEREAMSIKKPFRIPLNVKKGGQKANSPLPIPLSHSVYSQLHLGLQYPGDDNCLCDDATKGALVCTFRVSQPTASSVKDLSLRQCYRSVYWVHGKEWNILKTNKFQTFLFSSSDPSVLTTQPVKFFSVINSFHVSFDVEKRVILDHTSSNIGMNVDDTLFDIKVNFLITSNIINHLFIAEGLLIIKIRII